MIWRNYVTVTLCIIIEDFSAKTVNSGVNSLSSAVVVSKNVHPNVVTRNEIFITAESSTQFKWFLCSLKTKSTQIEYLKMLISWVLKWVVFSYSKLFSTQSEYANWVAYKYSKLAATLRWFTAGGAIRIAVGYDNFRKPGNYVIMTSLMTS